MASSHPLPALCTDAVPSLPKSAAAPLDEVLLTAPQSLPAAAGLGLAAVALIAAATLLIEVPDRLGGRGILMPADGIVEVRAPSAGILRHLRVTAGQRVEPGEPLALLDRDVEVPASGSLAAARRDTIDRQQLLLAELGARRQLELRHRRDNLHREREQLERALRDTEHQETVLDEALAIARARRDRYTALAERGSISADQAADARQHWLDARFRRLEHRARAAGIARQLEDLKGQLLELAPRSEAAGLELVLERERLHAERSEIAEAAAHRLLAPVSGTVLRVFATSGSTVSAGARVFSIASAGAPLDVWVYVPARRAARLRTGSTIELMVDALPHQRYGTISARVLRVGRVALRPGDPIAAIDLREPSFELRARIDRDAAADVLALLPGPGASFRTEIVRERLTLARWLFRLVSGS